MNILWISTDQLRRDTPGVTGNPWVHTPNLDRLAGEGVLFEQAYCNNSACMPSRSNVLTGCYTRSVGVGYIGINLPEAFPHACSRRCCGPPHEPRRHPIGP